MVSAALIKTMTQKQLGQARLYISLIIICLEEKEGQFTAGTPRQEQKQGL